jgi:hypothetical protein
MPEQIPSVELLFQVRWVVGRTNQTSQLHQINVATEPVCISRAKVCKSSAFAALLPILVASSIWKDRFRYFSYFELPRGIRPVSGPSTPFEGCLLVPTNGEPFSFRSATRAFALECRASDYRRRPFEWLILEPPLSIRLAS